MNGQRVPHDKGIELKAGDVFQIGEQYVELMYVFIYGIISEVFQLMAVGQQK